MLEFEALEGRGGAEERDRGLGTRACDVYVEMGLGGIKGLLLLDPDPDPDPCGVNDEEVEDEDEEGACGMAGPSSSVPRP